MRSTIITGLFLGACLIVSISFSATVPTADRAYGTWNSFGTETDHSVSALCEYQGDLIVAGRVTQIGDVPARSVARWDGSQWHPMGHGLHQNVHDLLVYNDQLYASVQLYITQGELQWDTLVTLARWDGTSWVDLGFHTDSTEHFHDMTIWDGKLIVTGHFFEAEGAPGNNIAAWDGTQWSRLGDGLGEWVWEVAVYNNELYALGEFQQTGAGIPASFIARFDGSQWQPVGAGLDFHAGDFYRDEKLFVYDDLLLAGGRFLEIAGGDTVVTFAAWNGSTWSQFGEPSPLTVFHISEINGRLFAGEYLHWYDDGTWRGADLPWTDDNYFIPRSFELFVWDSVVIWAGSLVWQNDLRYGGLAWKPLDQFVCCDGRTGNVDDDPNGNVDISDLTTLVNHLFVTFDPLPCTAEANTSSDHQVRLPDISDLTRLVNHLFVTFEQTDYCR